MTNDSDCRLQSTLPADYSYLTMVRGDRVGANFLLHPDQINRVGRGSDCQIQLADRGCSRVHAELFCADGQWTIRDNRSRNGVFLSGERLVEGPLAPGDCIRVGATEFVFHQSQEPPTRSGDSDRQVPVDILQQAEMRLGDSSQLLLKALENTDFAHELFAAYQLCVELLACRDTQQALVASLHRVHERTRASGVAFFHHCDNGQLQCRLVLPEGAEPTSIDPSIQQMICQQGKALWLSRRGATRRGDGPQRAGDSVYVPLVSGRSVLGALHLYLTQGSFRQTDFDLAISVANLMSASLARIRHDTTVASDVQRLVWQTADLPVLLGQSAAMRVLKQQIDQLATQSTGAIIVGEPGCGRTTVARAIHRASPRGDRPLHAWPVYSLRSTAGQRGRGDNPPLADGPTSEQVAAGHSPMVEACQRADLATLLLQDVDRLSDVEIDSLVQMVRGSVSRADARLPRPDVRLFMTVDSLSPRHGDDGHSRDWLRKLREQTGGVSVEVPPLRERGDDTLLLADHFLAHFQRAYSRVRLRFSDAAMELIRAYDWPGNVLQLRNTIQIGVAAARSDTLGPADLLPGAAEDQESPTLRIADWEQRLIRRALARTGGKVPEAAQLLGIGRATLYRKLDDYGIRRGK